MAITYHLWLRRMLDRLAKHTISVGGVAVIVSILAIFVFLLHEVAPLFEPPSAALVRQVPLSLPSLLLEATQVGLDEHREVAYLVGPEGVRFVELGTGHPIEMELPPELQNKRITAVAMAGGYSAHHVVGTADGTVIPMKIGIGTEFTESGARMKRPFLSATSPIVLSHHAIRGLAYRFGDTEQGIAAFDERGEVVLVRFRTDEDTIQDTMAINVPGLSGHVTALALDAPLLNLYVGTDRGMVFHLSLGHADHPVVVGSYQAAVDDEAVTKLGFLNGDRSLVVMTSGGAVSTWGLIRNATQSRPYDLQQTHIFARHPAAVVAFAPSVRDKSFVTADAEGHLSVHHATSGRTLLQLPGSGRPVLSVALAPRSDAALAYDAAGMLTLHAIHTPYLEATLKTLFGKVWYEGYDKPTYVWQSSSGSDEFEPKLSLVPLAFGTFKGTLYALLLAVPIAILAAIFTSQFMHPDLRGTIKPIIEVMAALPTVVLGFLAGLWLAPLLERIFPALVGIAIVIPLLVLISCFAWRRLPRAIRGHFRPGTEALLLIPVIVAGLATCFLANDLFEQVLFDGNFKAWLSDRLDIRYDQRNAVVVGIVMGFAIIPIIYSIAEEALSNVPRHLIAGSLALGATQWQTVAHLVLLAASPGIFSAVMIGFGRAIGETMIVLMATGNTPILDWSWSNGFRTLSANIAVEIPEAPYGGTLYRVLFLAALLLFVVTFAINTVAEVVRQRLRAKYSHQ